MEVPGTSVPEAAADAEPAKRSGFSLRVILMGILLAFLANLVLVALIGSKPPPEWEDALLASRLLHDSHVTRPARAKMAENAVAGMAMGLGDPYTQFLPEGEATQWESRLRGEGGLRPLAASEGGAETAWLFDPAAGLGYAALARFSDHSAEELGKALEAMRAQAAKAPAGKLRGVVLDLRGNPGGYLKQARDMAGLFLPKGTLFAKIKGPDFPEQALRTEREPLADFPLVVLVDGASASASEALAGALQEHGRAFVVGARSFGKGCVQTVTPLENLRAKLKTTVAYWFLPSGRCLHRNGTNENFGVAPSPGGQVVPSAAEEKARQALLKSPPAGAATTPEALRDVWHDPALAAASAALAGRGEDGAWPRVGDDPSPGKDDPHWRTREEIRTLEARLRQLRRELTTPTAPK